MNDMVRFVGLFGTVDKKECLIISFVV